MSACLIANTEGLYTTDRRVTTRMRMQAVVADGDSAYGTWDDYTKASGFEAYDDELSYTSFAKDMVKRAESHPHGWKHFTMHSSSCVGGRRLRNAVA